MPEPPAAEISVPDAVDAPSFKVPEIDVPEFGVKIPEFSFSKPEGGFKLPDVGGFKLPEVKVPDVDISGLKLPEVKMPEVSLPEEAMPEAAPEPVAATTSEAAVPEAAAPAPEVAAPVPEAAVPAVRDEVERATGALAINARTKAVTREGRGLTQRHDAANAILWLPLLAEHLAHPAVTGVARAVLRVLQKRSHLLQGKVLPPSF